MDVPIHVQDGDTTLVRFEGRGLMSPELDSKQTLKSPEPGSRRQPFPGQVRALLVFLNHIITYC